MKWPLMFLKCRKDIVYRIEETSTLMLGVGGVKVRQNLGLCVRVLRTRDAL